MTGSPAEHATAIKARATALGFDLVGIAGAEPSAYRDHLRTWLDEGKAGEMKYLENRFAERVDPSVYFPGVRSIVCVAVNYHVPVDAPPPGHARIARYAQGDDYHERLMDNLRQLADWMRTEFPGSETRCATDSAPVAEREFAARAGLGWVGKHTLILHPRVGSWLLLGEVLTTLALPPDSPMADHCGTCTRCIDACPTDAITGPQQLDPRKCISYLTIEHRGQIDPVLQQQMGDWVVGCDICQEVCPFNRRAPESTTPWLQPRRASNSVDPDEVLNWSLDDYHRFTRHSSMRRVKLPMFQRNAAIARRNIDTALLAVEAQQG
jgi:epoxyqueuosine reductase